MQVQVDERTVKLIIINVNVGFYKKIEFKINSPLSIFRPLSFKDFLIGWSLSLTDIMPGINETLDYCSKKLRLVIFSNTNPNNCMMFPTKYEKIMSYFEKKFLSCYINTLKPEPDGYIKIIEYLNIDPDEMVFIDNK